MRQILSIFIFIMMNTGLQLSAQVDAVWQAYYDSTAQYWGYEWEETEDLLINARDYLESNTEAYLSDSTYILTLIDLALCIFEQGRIDESLELHNEVATLASERFGRDHPMYEQVLNNLAGIYHTTGEYDKSERLYKESLTILENAYGRNHPEYGNVQKNLAGLYSTLDRLEEAMPLLEEAVNNAADNFGKDDPVYLDRLSNLASLYSMEKHYEKSLRIHRQVMDKRGEVYGKDHYMYGYSVGNLAITNESIGRYDEALLLFKESCNVIKLSLGSDHYEYASCLSNLAGLYSLLSEYDLAADLYKEALWIIRNSVGRTTIQYGLCLAEYADLCVQRGDYANALHQMNRVLIILDRSVGRQHYENGYNIVRYAGILQHLKNYDAALSVYLEGLDIMKRTSGGYSAEYANKVDKLVNLYQQLGRHEEAVPWLLDANEHLMQTLHMAFGVSNEKNKLLFLDRIKHHFDIAHSFAYSDKYSSDSIAQLLFNNELELKGLILNSTQHILATVRNSGDTILKGKLDSWHLLREQLARQYGKPSYKQLTMVDSLERLAHKLEEELVTESAGFAEILSKVNWTDVQKKLQRDEVAIEFVNFRYHNKLKTESLMYAAMVLLPERNKVTIVPLFEESQIDAVLNEDTATSSTIGINSIYRGAQPIDISIDNTSEMLYELIWQPLEELLPAEGTIYFAPSGLLHQVAHAAIKLQGGMSMQERFNLVQLSSTRELVTAVSDPTPLSCIMYGGIAYDYTPPKGSGEAEKLGTDETIANISFLPEERSSMIAEFTFLPSSLEEVKNIKTQFKKSKIPVDLYTGVAASEKSFKTISGNSPKVLHIATHGFFFPNVTSSQQETFQGTTFKQSDNPLIRSGLAFAGVNYAWKNGSNPYEDEDGILTAYEISNMDLSNTDLVVLSACETGLGEIKGSEGVFGLQRAFKMAGVDHLMMSLWQVPDKETSEFMVKFYELWLWGNPIREAFRQTQLEMAALYPGEPYKWAAFVLVE